MDKPPKASDDIKPDKYEESTTIGMKVHLVPLSLGGPTSGLDEVATVDDGGDTDLGGSMSIVSDVLTIGQKGIKGLSDTGSGTRGTFVASGNDILGVDIDDDELTVEHKASLGDERIISDILGLSSGILEVMVDFTHRIPIGIPSLIHVTITKTVWGI